MYKKSKYNFIVPYNEEKTIIFNPLSGQIGLLDHDALERFEADSCTDAEVDFLMEKGIYIPDTFDEAEKMRKDRDASVNDAKTKYIRIWTTSACNAHCYYCYEKGIPAVHMTEATAQQCVKFIESMLNPGDVLFLEFFGGEPLLNYKIITSIIDMIIPICERLNVRYESKIISNGSLITDEIVALMTGKWKLTMAQITLDGTEEDYNRIKDYSCKEQHNFRRVLESIKKLSRASVHVAVRMNYDTSNYDSLSALIDFLKTELDGYAHIFYYVYPIWNCLNEDNTERFISDTAADKQYLALLRQLVDNNMSSFAKIARLNYRHTICKSCCIYGYSIFPDGSLGKCSETYHQIIGDIWRGVQDKKIESEWTAVDVGEECDSCKYLPICQGGCRSSAYTDMPKCYVHMNVFPDLLRWYVDELLKKKVGKTSPVQEPSDSLIDC